MQSLYAHVYIQFLFPAECTRERALKQANLLGDKCQRRSLIADPRRFCEQCRIEPHV